MQCRTVHHHFEAYAGNLCSRRQRRAIESHLASCPGCQAAWTQRRQIQEALRSTPVPAVPADFASRVTSAAREQWQITTGSTPSLHAQLWSIWRQMSRPAKVGAGAGLALGILLGAVGGAGMPASPAAAYHGSLATRAEPDPAAAYRFDALTSAPQGSLIAAYLGTNAENQLQEQR